MITRLFKVDRMSKTVIIPECNKDLRGMKDDISSSPPEKREGAMGMFSRFLRLDTLKRSVTASPTPTEPPTTYYGVYIPCEIKKGPDEEAIHVYEDKAEALELVRRYKQSRFKVFHNRQEAVSFALRGAEPDTTDGNDTTLMGEKPYPFKAPSPQDLVALRKAIEKGLLAAVRERVWDNPRYLVSSGNTPAIMQEGSRYNALHVAAKALNAEMCNLVLTTVGNPAFVQTLYGLDADADCCKEFAAILVDRYLNTPDKGMNETPLHFAAKFGAEACVDVLTAFPQCNKLATNKFGEQPKDIICKRANNASPETARRIAAMLEERFYVPVLHAEDGSAAPAIGCAFTPAQPPMSLPYARRILTAVPVVRTPGGSIHVQANEEPVLLEQSPTSRRLKEINGDPLSPRYEIRAFAGPMAAREAEHFRRKWKTPPRAPRLQPPAFRLRDLSKGLEAVGRNLAEEMKVGWKEYWPFLDTFTDLRTPEGLALLENYLKAKYESACSFVYNDSCVQPQSPNDISLSRISLGNLTHSPIKPNSMLSPMSELCVAMKTCTISADRPAHWKKTDPIRQRMCRQPTKALTNGDLASPTNHPNHSVSQLVCIERTCQVFAKRIADALTFSLTSEPEVAGESLKAEAKYLQHTMYTYMDDERFQNINFALIHSRLAQLAVFMLKRQTKDTDDVNSLAEFLVKLRCPNDDIFSSDDDKSSRGPSRVRLSHVIESHVRCLASFISEELTETEAAKGPSVSESECAELWEKASKCRCDWKIENFERNSKKNASFRKNRSILSTSPKSESLVRRLTFDCDIGDGKTQRNETARPFSVNSPAGDSAPQLFTVDTAKCTVVQAEISEDESGEECHSDEYLTASELSDDDDGDRMVDASDRALAEPFIYGEEPSKMDRLVFDALASSEISLDSYPNVYRWRHTVALYSPTDRDKWPEHTMAADDSVASASFSYASPLRRAAVTLRARASTPNPRLRDADGAHSDRCVPLQVSNWLRVTGPNSPRSALPSKNLGHNVSFGF